MTASMPSVDGVNSETEGGFVASSTERMARAKAFREATSEAREKGYREVTDVRVFQHPETARVVIVDRSGVVLWAGVPG